MINWAMMATTTGDTDLERVHFEAEAREFDAIGVGLDLVSEATGLARSELEVKYIWPERTCETCKETFWADDLLHVECQECEDERILFPKPLDDEERDWDAIAETRAEAV